MTDGKYTIELCREGGPSSGIETVLADEDRLTVARALYRHLAKQHPGRVVVLCDRARVLARSDEPDTVPG